MYKQTTSQNRIATSTIQEHITHDQMHSYYAEVNRILSLRGIRPTWVLGPSRGGADIAVKLSHYWNCLGEVFQWSAGVIVPFYQSTSEKTMILNETQILRNRITRLEPGSTVVIADDIVDSGATFRSIQNAIKDLKSYRFVYAAAIANTEQNDVCRFALLSNGDILTKR